MIIVGKDNVRPSIAITIPYRKTMRIVIKRIGDREELLRGKRAEGVLKITPRPDQPPCSVTTSRRRRGFVLMVSLYG